LSLAFVTLLGIASAASAQQARLMTSQEPERGLPDVVHVAVRAPPEAAGDTMEVWLQVEGPAEIRERQLEAPAAGPGTEQLVTVPWTPRERGEHELQAEVTVGGEVLRSEDKTVQVGSGAAQPRGPLPESAPGTVQWAIAFGFLFFVARAGIDRAP
jgi:hypothetical protein